MLPFEQTQINAPIAYDNILKKSYGDYMTPVHVDSEHGTVFFDLEHDYKDYYNGKLELKDRMFLD